MTPPRATYRLQLRPGFGFEDAAAIVDYLDGLGVSHLYASPSLQSASGSAHGYDVVDPSRLDDSRGGAEGHRQLVAALRGRSLGMVLDIVPNHVGISSENPWWWDVLQHGPDSRYGRHFDIFWEPGPDGRPQVLVPELGSDLVTELVRKDDLRLARDRGGQVVVAYHEHHWPLRPGSLLEAGLPADDPDAAVEAVSRDRGRLLTLLVAQHYRLAHWRRANAELNYRRFFDITSLAAVRIEDDAVFEDAHRRILDLVSSGAVTGLRVDHPDGLRDPAGYARRLRAAAPDAWIVFEKILEGDEKLRNDWSIDGTVGYEFTNLVLGLFVDPAARLAFDDCWVAVTGDRTGFHHIVADAKREVLDRLFGAEFERLVDRLDAAADEAGMVADRAELASVLRDTVVTFPVYRTYVRPDQGELHAADRAVVEEATARVRTRHLEHEDTVDLIRDLVTLELRGPAASDFVWEFQQLTGPATAKGVEDTALYRYLRFVALNEVGGDPARFGRSVGEFHRSNRRRQRDWPATMLTTSTHDTKRSEDVRARLAVLSELPDAWVRAVSEWRYLAARYRGEHGPSPAHEYLVYQTVVGTWPISADRLVAYLTKAAREGKQHTSWTDQHAGYEADLEAFARGLLADAEFIASLERFLELVIEPGWLTSLSQTLLQLTAPGVPDLYQGTELWDFSLVDPDNRRAVDFDRRRKLLGELGPGVAPTAILARMSEGLPKLWLVRQALHLRRERPAPFGPEASYDSLYARGPKEDHIVAFVRGGEVAVVAPRLVVGLGGDFLTWEWGDTSLSLPDGSWRDVMTGYERDGGETPLEELLAAFPVALLAREG